MIADVTGRAQKTEQFAHGIPFPCNSGLQARENGFDFLRLCLNRSWRLLSAFLPRARLSFGH